MKKILNRRAFAQEFRIRRDTKTITSTAVSRTAALQLEASTRRHSALLHDQLGRTRLCRNLLRHVIDGGKIRTAIGPRRSTHADKNGFAEANCFASVGSVGNFPALARGNQNLVQVVL